MSGHSQQLKHLLNVFGSQCHYCGENVIKTVGNKRQATREHIVPRAYGGPNSIKNYVLACAECNNARGTSLFYCECEYICGPVIRKAMEGTVLIDTIFKGIIDHNRHRVYRNHEGVWCSQIFHGRKHHDTWQDAMDYVLTYEYEGARNGV